MDTATPIDPEPSAIDAERVERLVCFWKSNPDTTRGDYAISDAIGLCEPLIRRVCWKHARRSYLQDPDAAIQVGREAVLMAAAEWDGSEGSLFLPFAARRVRWEVLRSEGREIPYRRHHSTEAHDTRLEADGSADPALSVSGASDHDKAAREAHRAVSGLTDERERELVVRTYWGGETVKAVAEELGIDRSRASHIRRRALRRMAETLDFETV